MGVHLLSTSLGRGCAASRLSTPQKAQCGFTKEYSLTHIEDPICVYQGLSGPLLAPMLGTMGVYLQLPLCTGSSSRIISKPSHVRIPGYRAGYRARLCTRKASDEMDRNRSICLQGNICLFGCLGRSPFSKQGDTLPYTNPYR